MLTCHDATRLMSEQEDRRLTLPERLSLRMHLLICDGCRNFGMQMRSLRQFVRGYARGVMDKRGDPIPPPDDEMDEP